MENKKPTFSITHDAVLEIKKMYPNEWKTIITDLIESDITIEDLSIIRVDDIVVLKSGSPYLVVTEVLDTEHNHKIIKCVQESDRTIEHELEDYMLVKLTKNRGLC